jgi:hypothetical protein
MSEDRLIDTLRARIKAVAAERDSALAILDRREAEAEERERLLIEEQDRFVTRLLANHEGDAARLRAERLEATEVAEQLRKKLERSRRESVEAEERSLRTQCTLQQLTAQREELHAELKVAQDRQAALLAQISRLSAELDLARTMLGYAIEGDAPPGSPGPDERETLRPEAPPIAAESGFVRSRERAPRQAHGGAPTLRQTDPGRPSRPRARAMGADARWDRKPPSSR